MTVLEHGASYRPVKCPMAGMVERDRNEAHGFVVLKVAYFGMVLPVIRFAIDVLPDLAGLFPVNDTDFVHVRRHEGAPVGLPLVGKEGRARPQYLIESVEVGQCRRLEQKARNSHISTKRGNAGLGITTTGGARTRASNCPDTIEVLLLQLPVNDPVADAI